MYSENCSEKTGKKSEILEIEQRQKNLKILGVQENKNVAEDIQAVEDLIMFQMDCRPCPRFTMKRLGQKSEKAENTTPRPILIKFDLDSDRNMVWKSKKNLHGTKIVLQEDLPSEIEARSKKLVPFMQRARSLGLKSNIHRDSLFVSGIRYGIDQLQQLPQGLTPSEVAHKENDEEIFFFGRDSFLSNFHNITIPFTEEGQNVDSSEKYYQYNKAKYFDDKNKFIIQYFKQI